MVQKDNHGYEDEHDHCREEHGHNHGDKHQQYEDDDCEDNHEHNHDDEHQQYQDDDHEDNHDQ